MISTWVLSVMIFGVNFTLWGAIGLLRLLDGCRYHPAHQAGRRGRIRGQHRHCMRPGLITNLATHLRPAPLATPHHPETGPVTGRAVPSLPRRPLTVADVAVLMAAHNEEVVIGDSLKAIIALVPAENIHVVSDFSSDRTVELARQHGVNVIETATNVGKAGALAEGIRRFRLVDQFDAVLLLDADTRLDPAYFTVALPLFDDPQISVVAGCCHSHWRTTDISHRGRLLTAYRSRIYALTQRLLKYGQTWSVVSVTYIVPGFASVYRTDIITDITINPPGLVIEDFNMTFEIHQKKLGRIGFSLKAIAVTQDPDNLHDYIRQIKRWTLGLWQTVRRHRLRPGLFSAALSLLLLELLSASLLFVLLPILVMILAVPDIIPPTLDWSWVADAHSAVAAHLALHTIVIGVLIPDYLLTCVVAAVERRPQYLLYGVLFVFMRTIDAAIALYTLPRAWREKSSGQWVSPTRRDPTHGTAPRHGEEELVSTVAPTP